MYTSHSHPQPPASFPPASSSNSWQGQDGRLPRTHGLPHHDFHQGPPHPAVYHQPESGASRTVHAQHRFDPYGRPTGYSRLPHEGYPMYPTYPGFPGDGNFMPAYNPSVGPQRGPPGPMVQPMPPRPEVPPQRRRNYQKKPYPDGCHVCGTSATPEWRRGPSGLRTLCNACGLSAKKFKHDPPKDLDQCVKQLLEIGRARQRTAEEHVRSPENMLRVTQSFNSRFDKDDAPRPRATSHASRRSSAGSASPPRAALQLSPMSFSHPHGFTDQRLDPNYTDAEMDSATLLCSLGGGSPSSATPRPLPGGQSQRESDVAHALASMREGNSPQSNRTAPLPVIDPIFAHMPMIDPIFMTNTDERAALVDQERPSSTSSRSSGGNPMAISSLVETK